MNIFRLEISVNCIFVSSSVGSDSGLEPRHEIVPFSSLFNRLLNEIMSILVQQRGRLVRYLTIIEVSRVPFHMC